MALSYRKHASKATVFKFKQIPISISTESPIVVPVVPEPSVVPETPVGEASPWEPLASPIFRIFWLTSLASNVGTWIHEVGAGWLMTSLDNSPHLVTAVRVAMSVPILLLAIPAGTLADRVDRRRLLIGIQCVLMITAATISWLTFAGRITPGLLLALTCVMGLGMVVHVPTWQASIPELVPRRQLPQAVALGSISFNLARSIGPAIGGLMIATLGTWVTFAMNSVSFLIVLFVLLRWNRVASPPIAKQSFRSAVVEGIVFAANDRSMRHVLVRVILFVMPASALWSLMPLVAKEQLHWDSRGYGYLVGAVGFGAVAAALVLPCMRRRIGLDQTVFVATCLYACGLAITSTSSNRLVVLGSMFVMGAGWMIVLTTLNSTAQMTLPNSIRARGMACYLSCMAGAMALGAWTWGAVAGATSPGIAELIAALLLPITAVAGNVAFGLVPWTGVIEPSLGIQNAAKIVD